jgi:two-component system chemotaxis response regulator CheY
VNTSTRSASARTRGSAARPGAPLKNGCPAAEKARRAPILIVDDDAAIRRTLSEILAMQGYAVRTAGDGAEALAVVAQTEPALVLLDMRMPLMDGWAFAGALRARGKTLPLIVMAPADRAVEWCLEVGGAESLGKPFDLGQLLGAVERVYQRRGAIRP